MCSRILRSLMPAIALTISLASPVMADLGAAKSFAVLSSGSSVTFKDGDNVNQVPIPGSVTCPGAAGCPMRIGGTTILAKSDKKAPDLFNADVIASNNGAKGLACGRHDQGDEDGHEKGGQTAICLGEDSKVAGACVTGGGAVRAASECARGADTSGSNTEVTTLLPQAGPDAAAFSNTLSGMTPTQRLPSIHLEERSSIAIIAATGLNVISVPSITTEEHATITISGGATDFVVINVGTPDAPGDLKLGDESSVVLTGGITPDRVVFNVEGSGKPVRLGHETTFNGTILGPERAFRSEGGDNREPVVVNGALLFGQSIDVDEDANINFYPLAQIARPATIRLIGTVDVMTLPPTRGGTTAQADILDLVTPPHIEEVPGLPGPPVTLTPISPVTLTPLSINPSQSTTSRLDPLAPDPTLQVELGFEALGQDRGLFGANRKVPPDTQIAVGQDVILELVNTSGAVYDKHSGSGLGSFDLGEAFLGKNHQGGDPRVLYDALTRTFFASYELGKAGGDDVRLAVASDPVIVAGLAIFLWRIYEVLSNNDDICLDQPFLGVSDNIVMLSWNDYPNCSNPPLHWTGSEYVLIQKTGDSGLIGGVNPPLATFSGPDSSRFRIVPVQSLSASEVQYAVYHNLGSSNFNLMTFVFGGAIRKEFSFDIGTVLPPRLALQPAGGDPFIETDDDRVLSAVWQNDNLWGTFNNGCVPPDLNALRSCIGLVGISTATSLPPPNVGPVLLENQVLYGLGGQDAYYGAVTLDGNGDLFVGFSGSAPDLDPTAVVYGVLGSDFGSTTGALQFTSSSAQPYQCQCQDPSHPNGRWGDYSGAASDPNDPALMWVAAEYSRGDWGTAIAGVFFGP